MAHITDSDFDLSKFTYDAARAGVVPTLSDCAVNSRHSSNNRPRNCSATSEGTVKSTTINRSSRPVKPENKQNLNLSQTLTHKDEGFAEFLKKHSSPTHNRVTTGGRIVPMERRESPPRFCIPAAPKVDSEDHDKLYDGQLKSTINISSHDKTGSRQPNPHGYTGLGHSTNRQTSSSEELDIYTFPGRPYIGACVPFAQFFPSQISDLSSMISPYMSLLPASHPQLGMPVSTQYVSHPLDIVQAPLIHSTWPYGSLSTLSYGEPLGTNNSDEHEPPLLDTFQPLRDARAEFEELDHQLKLIDRQRAMSSHDPAMAAQRMAIVQQRAEAKEVMDRCKREFRSRPAQEPFYDQSLRRHRQPYAHQNIFNAQAQPYVPVSFPQYQQHYSAEPAAFQTPPMQSNAVDRSQSGHKRKIIPIVAPPSTPTSTSQARATITTPLPSEGATNTARDNNQHAANSPDTPSNFSKPKIDTEICVVEIQKKDIDLEFQSMSRGANTMRLVETRDGGAHRDIREYDNHQNEVAPISVSAFIHPESCREVMYDALRLPNGTKVVCPTPDNKLVTVTGVDLQRPTALAGMSSWERDYWSRKPTFSEEMSYNLVKIHRESLDKQAAECLRLCCELLPTANRGGVLEKDMPDNGTKHEQLIKHRTCDELRCEVPPVGSVQKLFCTNHEISSEDVSPCTAKENFFACSPISPCNEVNTTPSPTKMRNPPPVQAGMEESLRNKGYSSVSTQNIHAMVRVPPTLDGAEDTPSAKHSAKSLLVAASKSPRLIRRSGPASTSWFGPYARDLQNSAEVDN